MVKSKITLQDSEVIDMVVNTVCTYYIIKDIFKNKSRIRKITEARQISFYFIKELLPKLSLSTLGKHCGGYDHSTVIYSIKTIRNLAVFDMRVKKDLLTISENLKIQQSIKVRIEKDPNLIILAKKIWDDLYVPDKRIYTDFESYYISLFDKNGKFIFI